MRIMGVEDIEMICKRFCNKQIIVTNMDEEARDACNKLEYTNLYVPIDGKIFDI